MQRRIAGSEVTHPRGQIQEMSAQELTGILPMNQYWDLSMALDILRTTILIL